MALADLQRPELLQERVADRVREAILEGSLQPGERLVEFRLSKQWNISRAPLREAIRQLAAEGLLTLSPHRGATVAEVSLEELHELFSVRSMLEAFGAGLAAKSASPDHLAAMRHQIAEMRASLARRDLSAFYVAGLEFHSILMGASGNSVFRRIYDQNKRQFRRYQALMPRLPDLPQNSIDEHQQILDAVEKGDADAASEAARHHIAHLIDRFPQAASSPTLDVSGAGDIVTFPSKRGKAKQP